MDILLLSDFCNAMCCRECLETDVPNRCIICYDENYFCENCIQCDYCQSTICSYINSIEDIKYWLMLNDDDEDEENLLFVLEHKFADKCIECTFPHNTHNLFKHSCR